MENSIFDLREKVILITGGQGHLGSAMSEILAEYGAHLIIASKTKKSSSEFIVKLKKMNENVEEIFFDIGDEASINNAVSDIIKNHGRIDVLINNAYYGAGKEFEKMSFDEWEKGIDGSIHSVYRLTHSVLKYMLEQKNGNIINIASMYGIVAPNVEIYENNEFYNPINYGVGKAGIIQFTKYIAAVYGKNGITCNAISPGPFPNEKVTENKTFVDLLCKKVPLGRVGKPKDLQGIVLLLASNAASYINGANISVDGGWTIW